MESPTLYPPLEQTVSTISKNRINSVDVLRGIVMIIMAIDHVRVYSGIPAGAPEAGIFFTRWITHFCAPTFTFFAGTSAFLYFTKTHDSKDTMRFLLTRGLLLVIFELTIVRFSWTFNLDYSNYTLAGVIWMLGWCMILLAPFVKMRPTILAGLGLFLIFGQQLFAFIPLAFPESVRDSVGNFWGFFYPIGSRNNVLSGTSGLENIFGISILYVLIPWIGVMMCGFAFGSLLLQEQHRVKKVTLWIGAIATVLFIIIAAMNAYQSTDEAPFYYKLLNQRKYPASQLYLLMTLGPVILLISWAQGIKGFLADKIRAVGRVPMFFYLLHIPLIHLSAFVVNIIISGTTHQEWYDAAPLVGISEDNWWPLWLLYTVWAIDTLILIMLSERYAAYKAAHPAKAWLKYI